MKIALIAPPFIAVPPADYGGTELFIADLAKGLKGTGAEPLVYTVGESQVDVERRWLYQRSQWPIKVHEAAWLRDLNHESWAVRDAVDNCDVVHFQTGQGIVLSRFIDVPAVLTLHGPHDQMLSDLYAYYPDIYYVCISDTQCSQESMPRIRTIHHGIDLSEYKLVEQKQQYLSFIGRIAPMKGTHTAIEVAKQTGIPLKIAGDVQPMYRDYYEAKVKPQLDGKLIEYVGRADLAAKNELLGNSIAMLFPIQWSEPFGLVMVEAMACGTPVLAMPRGSVPEVVKDGVSGHICRTVKQMVERVKTLNFDPRSVRQYVQDNFSLQRMAREYLALYEEAFQRAERRDVA